MKTIIETLKQSRLLTLGALVLLSMSACSGSDSNGKKKSGGSCDGVEAPALGADEEAATIPAHIAGTYTLTYDETEAGSGFETGDVVDVEILEDGALNIGDVSLCHPVLYLGNDAEAIWKDSENDLAFAISNLDPEYGFNEVNVSNNTHYDQGGFTFYGQLREDK